MTDRTRSTLEAVDRLLGVSEPGSGAASADPLVTSAKTRDDSFQATDWDAFLRQANESQRTMRFPTADLIGAAAAAFPQGVRQSAGYRWSTAETRNEWVRGYTWKRHGDGTYAKEPSWTRQRVASAFTRHHVLHEGVYPHVLIGPGVLKFSRANVAAAERAADRRREPDLLVLPDLEPDHADDCLDPDTCEGCAIEDDTATAVRGAIVHWSPKSRARLRYRISTLDLQPMLNRGTPAMVTLTMPGDWYAVAPDAATAQRAFDNFTRAYRDKWGQGMQCIWKREFQRRGAPHWHLWMVLPTDDATFKRWLADTWRRCLKVARPAPVNGVEHVTAEYDETGKRTRFCSCSDWCKSYNAGTSVDRAEGMRARDPRRLATYFLKESMGGAKEYQNAAPDVWGVHNLNHAAGEIGPQPEAPLHPSVGRFWGVRGIKTSTVEIPVAPEDQYRIWRVLRRIREIRLGKREVRVQRGERLDVKTGELVPVYRKVSRRARVRQAAGWVLVNDGAATAERLGTWLAGLHDERTRAAAAAAQDQGVFPDADSDFWDGSHDPFAGFDHENSDFSMLVTGRRSERPSASV